MKSFNYTKISEKLLTQVAIKSRKYDYYNNGCLNLSKISNLHLKT